MDVKTSVHGDGKDLVECLIACRDASVLGVVAASDFERMFIFASQSPFKFNCLKLLGTLSRGWRSSRTFTIMEMVP
jgi:hypothetical protein